ncbi:MAG: formylglycine-generating enzyme family protein [Lentisphaeria bacterium]|nr:formylglycine-generating enzyme family protein [Lentisphaeria bacterium]
MKLSDSKSYFGKHISFLLQIGAVLVLCGCTHVGTISHDNLRKTNDRNVLNTAQEVQTMQKCLDEIKAWGVEMVLLPAGNFQRGKCTVSVSSFAIGVTEVTQAQWKKVMGSNPSAFQGDDLPVENVTWEEAMAFCEYLNEKAGIDLPEGYHFSLPTEAQWEYACHAGRSGAFGGDSLPAMAWYQNNSGDTTHPVGTKMPNDWGLYDMHGNVNEWCYDWYAPLYPEVKEMSMERSDNAAMYEASYSGGKAITDPTGPAEGIWRVNRGGCWYDQHFECTATYRYFFSPNCHHDALGFRVALVPIK